MVLAPARGSAFNDGGSLTMISQSEIRLLEMKLSKAERRIVELEAELEPYRRRDENECKARERQERVELISATLFPVYSILSVRSGHEKAPLQMPGLGWWNGAEIEEWWDTTDGGIHLKVKSYVAGGNYEDFECDCPAEWMTTDDPVPLIQRWLNQKIASAAAAKKRSEIAQAKAEIKRNAERLARLERE